MMKKHLTYSMIVAFSFFSCNGNKHEKEVAQLSQVRAKLKQADSLLGKTDPEQMEHLQQEIQNNVQYLQFNLSKMKDTLNQKQSILVSDYHQVMEPCEIVADNHKKLSLAIDSLAQNVDNLDHDLTNDCLAKGITPQSAVDDVSRQAGMLYESAGDLHSRFVYAVKMNDSLSPLIKNLMTLLNQQLLQATPVQK